MLLFLLVPWHVVAQGDAASVSAEVKQFGKDFAKLKDELAQLQQKIEDATRQVANNIDMNAAKGRLAGLMEAVSALLRATANNGTIAKLGDTTLEHVRKRLGDISNATHFSKEQREEFATHWKRVLAETESAVVDLNKARGELADLLTGLQTNEDVLAEREAISSAEQNAKILRGLADELRAMATKLRDLGNGMRVPSS